MHTVIAIDYGVKRLGLAIGDLDTNVISSLGILLTHEFEQIYAIIESRKADIVLLGNPLMPNGSESIMSQRVGDFRQKLQQHLSIPIELIDERYTSIEYADIKNTNPRSKKKKKYIDDLSATSLINQWLHEKQTLNTGIDAKTECI